MLAVQKVSSNVRQVQVAFQASIYNKEHAYALALAYVQLLGALTPTTNEYESTNHVDIFRSSDPEDFCGSATDSIM
jgi:hypothetical protein